MAMNQQPNAALPVLPAADANAATFEARTKSFADGVAVAQRMAEATQCVCCLSHSTEKVLGDACKTGGHLICGECFPRLVASQRNPANMGLFAQRGQTGKCPSCNKGDTLVATWKPNVALNRVCREIGEEASIPDIAAGARQATEMRQSMAAALFFLTQAVGPSGGATATLLPLMQQLQAAPAPAPPAPAAAPAPAAMEMEPLDEDEPDGPEDEDWEDAGLPQAAQPPAQPPVQVAPLRRGRPVGANARHQITARAEQYRPRRSIVSSSGYNRNKARRAALEARLGAKLPWPCTSKTYLDRAEELIDGGYSAGEIRTIILAQKEAATA